MRLLLLTCALLLAACDHRPAAPVAHDEGERAAHTFVTQNVGAFFDCLQRESTTIVAAHRGGPAPGYAENAIRTFEHTLQNTPAVLEIDIARTNDGALVLMHDDAVDRTTNGTGAVSDLTASQFAALQLQDEAGATLDEHPPTLQQVLEWSAGRTILELDVKRGVRFEDVIAAVRAANAQNRVIVITYNDADALRVHRLAPDLMISAGLDSDDDITRLQRRGMDLTRVLAWTGIEEPNSALNVALQRAGIETLFGTLGNPATSWDGRFARGAHGYSEFAETGIELIATDRPIEAALDLGSENAARAQLCLAPR